MYSYYTVQIIASQAFSGFGVRESCSRFYAVMGTGKANVKSPEVAHCGVEWSYLDTVKAAARPPHSQIISVRGSKCCDSGLDDCDLARPGGAFPARRRTAGARGGRSGLLARRSVNFLLYCFGRKVRPKSGRFLPLFLFRRLLI